MPCCGESRTTNLATDVSCGSEGVSCSRLSDLGLHPPYNHYGDPDFYEFNGRGYVLVPLEGLGGVPNGLLISEPTKRWSC